MIANNKTFISLTTSTATTTQAIPSPEIYCVTHAQLVISAGSASMQVQGSIDGTTYTDLLADDITTSGDIATVEGRFPYLRVEVVGTGFTGVVALAQYGGGPGEVM